MEKFGVVEKRTHLFDPSAWTVGRAYRISIWEPVIGVRLDAIEAHDGLCLGVDNDTGYLRFIIITNGETTKLDIDADVYVSGQVSIMPYPFKPKEKEEK